MNRDEIIKRLQELHRLAFTIPNKHDEIEPHRKAKAEYEILFKELSTMPARIGTLEAKAITKYILPNGDEINAGQRSMYYGGRAFTIEWKEGKPVKIIGMVYDDIIGRPISHYYDLEIKEEKIEVPQEPRPKKDITLKPTIPLDTLPNQETIDYLMKPWKCSCGAENLGKFRLCQSCTKPRKDK